MSMLNIEHEKLKKVVLDMATKNLLHEFLMTVWREQPDAVRILFEELIKDPPEIAAEKEKLRRQKFKKLMEKDFEKYDEVFRNLAKY